jgi:multiple sugar transport system permease protein
MATAVSAPRDVAAAPGARPSAPRGHGEVRVKRMLYVVAAVLSLVVFVVPLLWTLMRSVQPNAVITAPPNVSTFFDFTTENFRGLTTFGNLARAAGNSLVVSLGAAALTTLVASAAGYGFGRFRFRGSAVAFALILVTMMVPFQAIITPLFMQLNAMHLTNSLFGLVLFYTTVNLPFAVFVMRTAFAAVPKELEEAANVDGAGTMRTLVWVVRPLIVPGMATAALYAFLASWTEFLGALTFLTDQKLYTLPVALLNLQQGAYGEINYGYLAAGAVVAMIPCVVLFLALQRYYVAGLSSGAVKG